MARAFLYDGFLPAFWGEYKLAISCLYSELKSLEKSPQNCLVSFLWYVAPSN